MLFYGIFALFKEKVDSENAEANAANQPDDNDYKESLPLRSFERFAPPLFESGKLLTIDPVLKLKLGIFGILIG